MTRPASTRLIDAIGKWIARIDDQPGWRDWQRGKVAAVLAAAEGLPLPKGQPDYNFPEPLNRQHAAIMSYMDLFKSLEALKQCEFYFRRYPFRGLPVTKDEHLRNICEMYFNRFYEFRERMKRCLNTVNSSLDGASKLVVGAVLKTFDKAFDQEIRARHRVHHFGAFDDLAFDTISIARLMAKSETVGLGWEFVADKNYSTAAREWSQRVIRRSKVVALYLEAVAEAMLTHCTYLQQEAPPTAV
jgi:hypothetical protein